MGGNFSRWGEWANIWLVEGTPPHPLNRENSGYKWIINCLTWETENSEAFLLCQYLYKLLTLSLWYNDKYLLFHININLNVSDKVSKTEIESNCRVINPRRILWRYYFLSLFRQIRIKIYFPLIGPILRAHH